MEEISKNHGVSEEELKEDVKDAVESEEENSEANVEINEAEEVSPEERLEQLKNFRQTGSVSVEMTPKDFKFVYNTFRNKVEWRGPNEAYMLNILLMGLTSAKQQIDTKKDEAQRIQLSNSTIEIMSQFQHRVGGKDSKSAMNHMGLFGMINNCMAQIKQVEEEIAKLEDELGLKTPQDEKTEKNG